MKTLLVMKAAVEVSAGLAFAVFPDGVFFVLFGQQPASTVVSRSSYIIGAALITLGIACWAARNDSRSQAATGLIAALLLYDVAFVVILVWAYLSTGQFGIGLWPVAMLHSGLAVSSLLCLKKSPLTAGAQ